MLLTFQNKIETRFKTRILISRYRRKDVRQSRHDSNLHNKIVGNDWTAPEHAEVYNLNRSTA